VFELHHVTREPVNVALKRPAESHRCLLIGPRSPSKSQVNASRKQRFKRAELLSDDKRSVIGEHNPARSHTDRTGALRNVANHHSRRRTRYTLHIMVLG
jgi:hypothetical protein